MASIYLDDVCKNCGGTIGKLRMSDPGWDGDTCSEECAQELSDLDVPWEEFIADDMIFDAEDYAQYEDEDLIPEDDREVS